MKRGVPDARMGSYVALTKVQVCVHCLARLSTHFIRHPSHHSLLFIQFFFLLSLHGRLLAQWSSVPVRHRRCLVVLPVFVVAKARRSSESTARFACTLSLVVQRRFSGISPSSQCDSSRHRSRPNCNIWHHQRVPLHGGLLCLLCYRRKVIYEKLIN